MYMLFLVAVKRCYENMHQSYLEQQDERAESSEAQAKRDHGVKGCVYS